MLSNFTRFGEKQPEIWTCWEENRRIRRKTLEPGTTTNNKLSPHMASTPGIEPGSHWLKASALTTVPSLLPRFYQPILSTISRFAENPFFAYKIILVSLNCNRHRDVSDLTISTRVRTSTTFQIYFAWSRSILVTWVLFLGSPNLLTSNKNEREV